MTHGEFSRAAARPHGSAAGGAPEAQPRFPALREGATGPQVARTGRESRLTPIPCTEIVKKLEHIREIRNDVIHFDPDPLDHESGELLRSFSKFLDGLLKLLK